MTTNGTLSIPNDTSHTPAWSKEALFGLLGLLLMAFGIACKRVRWERFRLRIPYAHSRSHGDIEQGTSLSSILSNHCPHECCSRKTGFATCALEETRSETVRYCVSLDRNSMLRDMRYEGYVSVNRRENRGYKCRAAPG
ncbi:hypothetical protein K505DRAFT_341677 [Melanomma pulvis-pyrius CBS 109.77]|uniref:Uncharacterized protein n=1 Tax=Melanomma pulvis-pyrius CBS 109.77 TaxID=1314802 RepID=A0A6A6WXI1_9PLEO|nr:hypothetical protein K505DRAFT_341677 [Melanomma pulvis-pyrius CBS 109.77]